MNKLVEFVFTALRLVVTRSVVVALVITPRVAKKLVTPRFVEVALVVVELLKRALIAK